MRARYYDPSTGQFLSRDPLVALTQSAYGYVGDNPLNATDPSGLFCIGDLCTQDLRLSDAANGYRAVAYGAAGGDCSRVGSNYTASCAIGRGAGAIRKYVPLAAGAGTAECPSGEGYGPPDAGESAGADTGHAGIHQYPGIEASKSQFFDGENLSGLSDTSGAEGALQNNGNTRFVMHTNGAVGVDRTTGLPTDTYTVIRGPDGRVITMFPGTSPRS
jgi:uncharacterized protein RhaS with RHS repeats